MGRQIVGVVSGALVMLGAVIAFSNLFWITAIDRTLFFAAVGAMLLGSAGMVAYILVRALETLAELLTVLEQRERPRSP